jgi:hypothetical protein
MKKILAALLVLVPTFVFALPASDAFARHRPHVRIHKAAPLPPRPTHPIAHPVAALPVVAVAFDIARRTSCDSRVAVGTGPGDPGFDPAGPKVGNFLVPAIYRSECGGVRPRWYGW